MRGAGSDQKSSESLSGTGIGLRARMAASPLCDGPSFARTIEATYRRLWRDWCGEAATMPICSILSKVGSFAGRSI